MPPAAFFRAVVPPWLEFERELEPKPDLPEPSIAAGPTGHGLADLLGTEVARLGEGEDASAFASAHEETQLVVVVQDAHRHPWQQDAARGGVNLEAAAELLQPR